MTRARVAAEIREASRHVVIDAVVAPQDGSGPCRSVTHNNEHLAPTSQKGRYLMMRCVGHPLPSAGIGLDAG